MFMERTNHTFYELIKIYYKTINKIVDK